LDFGFVWDLGIRIWDLDAEGVGEVKMKRSRIIMGIIFALCLFFLMMIVLSIFSGRRGRMEWGRDKIGIIHIRGVITGGRAGRGLLGRATTSSETIMRDLKKAREDPSVKAVVLRINSPGGSAAASQEIYEEIENCRKGGKKIVVSMSDLAASGGYYIASAADCIVANPATLTGSIGVIMELEDLRELFKKIGIRFDVIKSGEYKDIGSPLRRMTREERKILRGLIDDIFDQFVGAVAKGRGLSYKEVKRLADGRVFTGRQAHKLHLVDKLGNFQYAIKTASKLAKIKGEPIIIEYEKTSPFDLLFEAGSNWWGEIELSKLLSIRRDFGENLLGK